MSWEIEKSTGDIVINGFETGIAPSPHKGVANIQNANISTETGEVMASYGRVQQSQVGITSTVNTLSQLDANHLITSNDLLNGVWITVTNSTITGLSNATYYVQNSVGTVGVAATSFQLSTTFNGSVIGGYGSGTANFVLTKAMGQPVASATESYYTTVQQYRYYILDSQGLVWVYDTGATSVIGTLNWFLPNNDVTYFSGGSAPSGLAVLNGWLLVFYGAGIKCKSTVNLGGSYTTLQNSSMCSLPLGSTPHFAFVGHQGNCYYTDGVYIGSIFPDSTLPAGTSRPNIQSYASYTASTVTGTFAALISGSTPDNGLPTGSGGVRIPAFFFTDIAGTQPTNLTLGTLYWIEHNNGAATFQVFAANTGGAAINIATGATGNQYYNTFYPVSSGGATSMVYTPQRLNLPTFEVAQCMAEIGNTVIIGCNGNIVYPWNQIDPTPSTIIALPENNSKSITTVNQMAYVFAGNKGNVYITDGNNASLVIKVPDYAAGIAGTPSTYVEPVFVWGSSMYLRGRVYFSILDQTTTKTGNCGGIWSFVPTQNLYIGQDTGLALRLENQNSYGNYNGVATVLLPNQIQTATSPQYWSGWYSSVSSPLYGIDYTATTPVGTTIIETDLIPVGTVLNKYTGKQLEYKLSTPLAASENVAISWRKNGTGSYTSAGIVITPDGATSLSGYFTANFQGSQWVQLKLVLTPVASTNSSFVRLSEIRMR